MRDFLCVSVVGAFFWPVNFIREINFQCWDWKGISWLVNRDANQLEHHAQELRAISPELSIDFASDAEHVDGRVASIRKQVEILEHWE